VEELVYAISKKKNSFLSLSLSPLLSFPFFFRNMSQWRLPLIKFRYGYNAASQAKSQIQSSLSMSSSSPSASASAFASVPTTSSPANKASIFGSAFSSTPETIPDVPARFQRRGLSQAEIEAIQLGGAGFKI